MTIPLCYVLIPAGRQDGPNGRNVDFDAVYTELIAPAVEQAGLEPYRVVPQAGEPLLRRSTLEGLTLAEYAIADLTAISAALFYQLGVRDALRKGGTVLVAPEGHLLACPPAPSEIFVYPLSATGEPANTGVAGQNLRQRLQGSSNSATDGQLLQLIERPLTLDIEHTLTDIFRERVNYAPALKRRLREVRESGQLAGLQAIEQELGELSECEAGVLVDLFLSYRALPAWDEMIALAEKMPAPLARSLMVQEQLAFALNRVGEQSEATTSLQALIERRGASSETYGLLGRVHKDGWEAAKRIGDPELAAARLDQALEAYLKGFEADWRDAYPGINAATLMELHEPPDPRRETLIPVVVYAAERRVASGSADYWDHATLIEAAVLGRDRARAESALKRALAAMRERWEPQTTARNLRLIREARESRGERLLWADDVERKLERAALGHD